MRNWLPVAALLLATACGAHYFAGSPFDSDRAAKIPLGYTYQSVRDRLGDPYYIDTDNEGNVVWTYMRMSVPVEEFKRTKTLIGAQFTREELELNSRKLAKIIFRDGIVTDKSIRDE